MKLDEMDYFKKVINYNKSNEAKDNHIRNEHFERLNQKYILLQEKYAESYHNFKKDITSKAYRREYSKGGKNIHRGYYSPSCSDLVVGNSSRGRLIGGSQKTGSYDYEYIFDNQNKLICVQRYSDEFDGKFIVVEVEFIIYDHDKVLSLIFNTFHNNAPTDISECSYDCEKLMSYESALCGLLYSGEGCMEINVETFDYKNDLLDSFLLCTYNPTLKSLTQHKYTFFRDNKGFLSTYSVECISKHDSEIYIDHKPEIYKVKVKRK